jgi:hypothetical protein
VVLAVTGGEALYTDMGHFGRFPIRLAWFGFVMPALVLNYFGQGALLLNEPGASRAPSTTWAGLGADPDGGAGHAGDGHRLAGGDFRRLLGGAPIGADGPAAAHADHPYLGQANKARSTCPSPTGRSISR